MAASLINQQLEPSSWFDGGWLCLGLQVATSSRHQKSCPTPPVPGLPRLIANEIASNMDREGTHRVTATSSCTGLEPVGFTLTVRKFLFQGFPRVASPRGKQLTASSGAREGQRLYRFLRMFRGKCQVFNNSSCPFRTDSKIWRQEHQTAHRRPEAASQQPSQPYLYHCRLRFCKAALCQKYSANKQPEAQHLVC
ncbi:hypothetical protein N658DRAFT_186479 [Parathielavia hyrcaniae]|uniref:Uncharacterized protein n=1 Tax=Parathielavia hyrcaniae TaxID=113614 RepID=A0AAN6Q6V6_9PEZI|nr:hypothetical protein N658DRAFT_186479 [Parathielavia hyrcaniae]